MTDRPTANARFLTRLLVRAVVFAVVGFCLWLLLGVVADGDVADNPFWGAAAGLFVAGLSLSVGPRRQR